MINLWAILALFSVLFGQTTPALPTPIYVAKDDSGYPGNTGIQADTVFWSPDSTKLYFTVENADTNQGYENITYQYDLTTKQTTQVDTPGYVINLTDEQQTHFHAYKKQAFIAPNQQDFVYESTLQVYEPGDGGGHYIDLLAVGNLQQGTFLPTRVTGAGSVRWSADSSAFTIEQRTDGGGDIFSYVHGEKTAPWTFAEFSEVWLGGLLENQTVDDLSPDGQRLLFPRIDNGNLYLWVAGQDTGYWTYPLPGREVPVGKNIIGAAFDLTDDDKILVVEADGIVLDSLSRATSHMINPDINSTWANFASFSPDNREVALLADGDVLNQQVYVMPITP